MIIEGGLAPESITRLAHAVESSYRHYQAGTSTDPLVVIDPGSPAPPDTVYRADTACVVRTSGSTSGTGKRVELSWPSIEASVHATIDTLGGPADWLVTLPVHHVAGLQTVIRSVMTGRTPRPYRIGDDVPSGAYVSLVPTQLHRVLQTPDLAGLRQAGAILVGGAATSARDLAHGRERGLNLVTTYGMSETCGGCVYNGHPIGDTRIGIVDSAIVIHGSVVASGYVGGDDFAGTFRTNDAGRVHDGILEVHGRIDDAITTGGLTINPHLIDQAVARYSSATGYAIGVPDDTWGQRVVLVTDQPLPDISAQLRTDLGTEYVPKQIVTLSQLSLDSWPTLSSGKVDRRALVEIVRDRGNIR